jgi:hypothetical protein
MFFKKLTVPASTETKTVDSVQLWEVRWRSWHSKYDCDGHPEMEAFPSEEMAQEFAAAINDAYALLRFSGDMRPAVGVKKGLSV